MAIGLIDSLVEQRTADALRLAMLVNTETPSVARRSSFNTHGTGFDEQTALNVGLTRGPQGHFQGRLPLDRQQAFGLGLPENSGLILKGTQHPTYFKTQDSENDLGFDIIKRFGRMFSVPRQV